MLFFAILPFVFSDSLIDPVLMPRQLFLTLFLLFIWTFLLFTKKLKGHSLQISNLSWLVILCSGLLVVLPFVSIAYAHTTSESIYVASKYGIVFLFFITTYFLVTAKLLLRADLHNGVLVFFIIALLYGIYDIVLLLINDLDVLANAQLITSAYANKNLFASILLLCFWAVFSIETKIIFKYILIVLLTAFVLLTQSKIVIVAFVLMFLLFAIKNVRTYFKENKINIIIATSLSVITVLVMALNFSKFENVSNLHTLDTRYSLWINSLEMIKEYPFGVGAGNWQIFFPKYGLTHFDLIDVRNGMMSYQRPHNDFIWMFCELGFQGFVFYLSIFFIVIITLIRSLKKKNDPLPFLLLISVIGYCMVAFFDFPLERIEHQVLLSVIILLSMNYYDLNSVKYKIIKPVKYSPVYLMLICISLVVCCYRVKGEYFTRGFIYLNPAKNAASVIEKCNKAESFFYSIDPFSSPIAWHKGLALLNENNMEEAKLQFEKGYKLTPNNVHVLNSLGNIYERQNDTVRSKQYYQMALKISLSATLVIGK